MQYQILKQAKESFRAEIDKSFCVFEKQTLDY